MILYKYSYILWDMTTIAAVLRAARSSAGLTQRELAAKAGTVQALVARVESGTANPTMATVESLLSAAGFSVHLSLRPAAANVDPIVSLYMRDVDRSLIRENLKKSPEQRIRSLAALADLAREARRAGRSGRRR